MAGVGFLQSLWEKPIREAFGLTWIRWIVCVHAQRPWNGMWQGSMGRTARSFFFLIQEGTSSRAGSVRPSDPSSMLTSVPSSSPLMSSRSVHSLPYTLSRKKEETAMDVTSLVDDFVRVSNHVQNKNPSVQCLCIFHKSRIDFVASFFSQVVTFAQISTRCHLTVKIEFPLSQQRSTFNQISYVFLRGHDP